MLRIIWAELARPEEGRDWYAWATIAIGHAMIGAALAAPLGGWPALLRLSIGVVYWLAKERGDLRRGGSLRDGLVDAGFVTLGALYAGPWWWPAAVLGAVGAGVCVKIRKEAA